MVSFVFSRFAFLAAVAALVVPTLAARPSGAAPLLPRPTHVVVVLEENHSYEQVFAAAAADPYIKALAAGGASLTDSHGVTHPSEPNYLALFSGSTQGVTDDSCPHTFSAANLGSALLSVGRTFAVYAEDLPAEGATTCASGAYVRKHSPGIDFANLAASRTRPLTEFPADYTVLPTISFVIPNLNHDMHDGTIAQADTWLQQHLNAYRQWAPGHNSLLVVQWDEDDFTPANHIATIFAGARVRAGHYAETVNHYNVLRTLEDMYGLARAGHSAAVPPITDIWTAGP